MKITHVNTVRNIKGLTVPANSVLILYPNGNIMVATKITEFQTFSLRYTVKENKWFKCKENKDISTKVYLYWKNHKKRTSNNKANYSDYMKHDRKHKKGSGSKAGYVGITTDYECTKYALNDFPQSRWVQYN